MKALSKGSRKRSILFDDASLMHPANAFILPAYAKINWFLLVRERRKDLYHNIFSLMQCIGLCDYLTFEDANDIEVVSKLNLPVTENMVYKAASLMKKTVGYAGGARITLEKNIPVAAGLGGGSSDAACTMIGLSKLWGVRPSGAKLNTMAASLGSDVPFFLHAPAAVTSGRGEKVAGIRLNESFSMLLAKPDVYVPTSWAYAELDRQKRKLTKKMVDIKLFRRALNNRDFESLVRMMRNDFEELIMKEYPVVKEMKEKLLAKGAIIAAMSGSGPSVFGIFPDKCSAEEALGHMQPQFCCLTETII